MLELLIEEKRKRMIELALEFGFTANETIMCSQELDHLLNLKLSYIPSCPIIYDLNQSLSKV